MRRVELGTVVRNSRLNAGLSWVLVAFVAGVFLQHLPGDLLAAGFALTVGVLALIPAAAYRDVRVMLPWEVLLLAVLPLSGQLLATVPVTEALATYLSVAAIALIIAVELHVFTPVQMTPGFAVLFVVVSTMATAGVWAVARWLSDIYFGTTFLLDPTLTELEIETALMWEFVWSTTAGLFAGLIFEGYFRRRARSLDRVSDVIEVRDESS